MPGEDGIFRCIRASDGAVIWQEDLGLPGYSNVGAADVDGNGVEDFFYYSRAGSLVVVRGALKPGEKRLLWQLPIGPLVGGRQHPIFVDTDGDGFTDAEEIAYGSDPADASSVANQAPELVVLSNADVPENSPPGTKVGEFLVSDPDDANGSGSYDFSLVDGNGSGANKLFASLSALRSLIQ